jgi:hypothetical protein
MRKVAKAGVFVLAITGLALWGTVGTTQGAVVRVLVLLGGEYHPYEAGSKLMLDAAAKQLDINADFVRIDSPPEGFPKAEKATIPSNIGILDDPELNRKYDRCVQPE